MAGTERLHDCRGHARGPEWVQFLRKDPVGWAKFHAGLAAHSAQGSALTYGVAALGEDGQSAGGDVALHEDSRIHTASVFVPDQHQGRGLNLSQLFLQLVWLATSSERP